MNLNLFKRKAKKFKSVNPTSKHDITAMVGEPVLSFVKCLKADPKRFKLRFHSLKFAISTKYWEDLYPQMTNEKTGFVSLLDRKNNDTYYAILHKGLYKICGLPFCLNFYEKEYIFRAFIDFRGDAQKRKSRIAEARNKNLYAEKNAVEHQERMKLMEKFK